MLLAKTVATVVRCDLLLPRWIVVLLLCIGWSASAILRRQSGLTLARIGHLVRLQRMVVRHYPSLSHNFLPNGRKRPVVEPGCFGLLLRTIVDSFDILGVSSPVVSLLGANPFAIVGAPMR